LHTIRRQGF
ncbi:outer membrane beta-barrel domain protein, partial [Vibrio parahaemolyticus VP2007-007]